MNPEWAGEFTFLCGYSELWDSRGLCHLSLEIVGVQEDQLKSKMKQFEALQHAIYSYNLYTNSLRVP